MFKVSRIQGYKNVFYFGIVVTVPTKAKYLATDKDGDLFCYAEEPKDGETYWNTDDACYFVANIDFEGNWLDSLLEIQNAN